MTRFRLNIALVAAVALSAAAWSAPASANGERQGAAASHKAADVTAPTKARRAALRKRIAWRVRQPLPRAVPAGWYVPYERVAAHWPILFLGVGY
jgi:hypothetical protein